MSDSDELKINTKSCVDLKTEQDDGWFAQTQTFLYIEVLTAFWRHPLTIHPEDIWQIHLIPSW